MLMIGPAPSREKAGTGGSWSRDWNSSFVRPRFIRGVILFAWCGLVSGLLEVGTLVLRKSTFDPNHLYWMGRQFVWLIPLTNLVVFLAAGILLGLITFAGGRRGSWLAARMLCALTLLPAALVALPQIYDWALMLVALGIASRLVPALERHGAAFGRLVRITFSVVAGLVAILAVSIWGGDRLDAWRESSRPSLGPNAPNILLVVMDSVAADHLGLYGYDRPTSPTIDELANRGIRFASAQATASWTLPSHASVFTGRWPHELSAGWYTPLDSSYPVLGEVMGSQGYATAGFVGNQWYCGWDSGLARGFTVYRDYLFPQLTAFGMAVLVNRSSAWLTSVVEFLDQQLRIPAVGPYGRYAAGLFKGKRIEAAMVNELFLHWLSSQAKPGQPARPFFAFLNFADAHYPYQIPALGLQRFGSRPRNAYEMDLIKNWWVLDKQRLPPQDLALARDGYDSGIAHIDEYLGRLFDELSRRGTLERTWVIITADHGESFGEHAGVYCHGTSLYQTEVHVPLLIIPPAGGGSSPHVVSETVSLRDLAATVVDIAGLKSRSPFPGESLSRLWRDSSDSRPVAAEQAASGPALAEVVPNDPLDPDPARLLKPRWPLAALTGGDWSYIRREGNVHEQLFHVRDDAQEQNNLAGDPAWRPILEQMRHTLNQLTAGPLTPRRFNP
jgi:arylsulfatase A-like enzyme